MKNSFWGLMFIVMGILGIFFIIIFQDVTTSNDHNYYLLKETTEAAMVDAFDWQEWYNSGTIKIKKDKFVESFYKRFATSVSTLKDYTINIYQINEEPPKVSIEVITKTGRSAFVSNDDVAITVSNRIDAILEQKGGN